MELKELKNETLQLEAGLKQAKTKGTFKTSMQIRKDNQANQSVQDTQTLYYNNDNITSKTTRLSRVDIENESYCNKYFDEHQMLSEDEYCDMSEDLYAKRCYLPPINNASRKTDYVDKRGRISNWSEQKSDATNSCCCAYRDYAQDDDCLKYPKTLDICHRNGNNFHCHTKRNVPESNYFEFQDNTCCKGCFNSQPLLPPICDTIVQPLCRQSNNHHILPARYINITQQKGNRTEDLHCQCTKNNIHPNMEFQSCDESCCIQSDLIQCEYNYICQPYKHRPRSISKTKTEQLPHITKSERCQNNCLGTENTAPNLLTYSLKTDPNNLAIQVVPDKLCRSNIKTDLPQKLHDDIHIVDSPNSQEFMNKSSTTSTNDYVLRLETEEECEKIQCSTSNTFSPGIFLDTDTEDFKEFMTTVQLTGDNEVDKEICMFYRTKMCSF